MQCFQHPEEQAIGICSYCHTGVCPECSTEVLGMLSCVDSCERHVEMMHSLIHRGNRTYRILRPIFFVAGLAFLGLSFLCLLAALAPNGENRGAAGVWALVTFSLAVMTIWAGWAFGSKE